MKSSEDFASGRAEVSMLEVARFSFLNETKMSCVGTLGFSSLRRVLAMVSNIASIFAITSAFADCWDDAIGECGL